MIPALPSLSAPSLLVERFGEVLLSSGFKGDISKEEASRLALATDNSIFQICPEMILHPKDEADVVTVTKTLSRPEFKAVVLTARGGGTGTNGQALNHGVILDFSRYMTEILELNLEESWVKVQPGVVLDQLNRYLKPHGSFFSPAVSTSSRATIGGMVNNDSSGKGSLVYGKTSDHVLGMNMVLVDGTILKTDSVWDRDDLLGIEARPDRVGQVVKTVRKVCEEHAEEIEKVFPKMNRFMSGYNLSHVFQDGRMHLNYLLSGSEGTLGLSTEVKLKLTPIPKFSRLVAIKYGDFDSALRCAYALAETKPEAVESIDDKIMSMAREDAIWDRVSHLMDSEEGSQPVMAVNFVEYVGTDSAEVDRSIEALVAQLKAEAFKGVVGYIQADDPNDIAALWELRKKGVGLLGAVKGDRKPIAFVEDTAVPPENLADFIAEFSALLKSHDLDYGMFGHVDAGCMHVRPALDMTDKQDAALVKEISDEVCQLVKKYGGVMWGEHGRGIRSEYTPEFFGPVLYEQLRVIKTVFDPNNQLNPGKMVVPLEVDASVYSIEATTFRGDLDQQISKSTRDQWPSAMNCNGNGACHSVDADSVMCPSSKITKNRIHSPKGRAGLLREWLRRCSKLGIDPDAKGEGGLLDVFQRAINTWKHRDRDRDFHHQVYDAMMGCLSCKACSTQCPIKVDIPSMKSRFLEVYHRRYLHPLKDHLVAGVENMAPLAAPLAKSLNAIQAWPISKWAMSKVGMVDSPSFSSPSLAQGLASRSLEPFHLSTMMQLDPSTRTRSVVLVQDAFTSYFEADLVLDVMDLLKAMGIRVYVAPFLPNGKPMHVKGFMESFKKAAEENTKFLKNIEQTGIPLVAIEPSMALTYREEYVELLGPEQKAPVLLLQEWLSVHMATESKAWQNLVQRRELLSQVFTLFGHCTERTSVAGSQRQWKEIFSHFGLHLELTQTGCCGMAGTYGHETTHLEESKGIFEMSWKPKITAAREQSQRVLATGFSCRCQTKRFTGEKPQHPAQVLLEALNP